MNEDERLAWARLVSGRVRASREIWDRTHTSDKSESSDEERADIGIQRALLRALWGGTTVNAMEAVIHLGETFTLDEPTAAIDALGLVLCRVAILAEISELTMASVVDLALVIHGSGDVPLASWADLMRSVQHGLSGHAAVCARLESLAGVVARAIDDVQIKHGVEVDPMQLYRRIADEVIAGRMPAKPQRDPLELRYSLERQPEPAPRLERDHALKAMDQLVHAVHDAMHEQHGSRFSDGLAAMMARELAAAHDHADAKERELWEHGYGGQVPGGMMAGLSEFFPDAGERSALEHAGVTLVGAAQPAEAMAYEARQRLLDELVQMTEDMGGYPELDDPPVPGLAEQRICPQCAGLLSERGDGMLACPSQHEFTREQLQAIAAARTAGDGTG